MHGSGYERIASAGCSDRTIRRRVTQWARLGLAERLHAVTVDEFEGGDHTIHLGEVVELGIPHQRQEPLIFFRGTMCALEDDIGVAHPFWDG